MSKVYFFKVCKALLVMALVCVTLANCTLQSESGAVASSFGKSSSENHADTSTNQENVNGILVMAHGGGKAWNKQVEEAVLPCGCCVRDGGCCLIARGRKGIGVKGRQKCRSCEIVCFRR